MIPSRTIAPPDRREVGLATCVALVTATMVGTGVYTSLGFQLQDLRSGFSILVLWGLGGLISLCGALSYAELSARIPRSGGEYTYLSEIYHPALGFMAACVSLLAGFAAPIALSAMAFGSYLHAAIPEWPEKLSGLLAVMLITLLHLRSLETSSVVQNASTALKFLLVALFVAIGLRASFLHPQAIAVLLPGSGSFAELARPTSGIALLFVLYAYSGWNATTYLAGEVRNGRRTVGRSLILRNPCGDPALHGAQRRLPDLRPAGGSARRPSCRKCCGFTSPRGAGWSSHVRHHRHRSAGLDQRDDLGGTARHPACR